MNRISLIETLVSVAVSLLYARGIPSMPVHHMVVLSLVFVFSLHYITAAVLEIRSDAAEYKGDRLFFVRMNRESFATIFAGITAVVVFNLFALPNALSPGALEAYRGSAANAEDAKETADFYLFTENSVPLQYDFSERFDTVEALARKFPKFSLPNERDRRFKVEEVVRTVRFRDLLTRAAVRSSKSDWTIVCLSFPCLMGTDVRNLKTAMHEWSGKADLVFSKRSDAVMIDVRTGINATTTLLEFNSRAFVDYYEFVKTRCPICGNEALPFLRWACERKKLRCGFGM